MDKDEPEAYVIGWQPFIGLKIYLDSRPLIPRTETEWWTEQLLDTLKSRESAESFSVVRLGLAARSATEKGSADERPIRFLDLCAGSGAIGCAALKILPYMEVFFGEVDPAHEATILKNIRENNLDESRANIRIGDLFKPFKNMKFDVIAANPPYVPADRVLPQSVSKYEPAGALRAGEDGLDFIRRIALSVRCHLTECGQAWIECDSAHITEARALFGAQGLSTKICNDQYGEPRVVLVSFP
ncbi:MAG: methyltransferase [bacterium]|nr:methyltransferase [bacterium]